MSPLLPLLFGYLSPSVTTCWICVPYPFLPVEHIYLPASARWMSAFICLYLLSSCLCLLSVPLYLPLYVGCLSLPIGYLSVPQQLVWHGAFPLRAHREDEESRGQPLGSVEGGRERKGT